MKVLITPRGFVKYGMAEVEWMTSKGITVHLNDTGKQYTPEQFLALAQDADAIIVGVDLIDAAFMEACPQLKVICKFGVGTDNIDLDAAQKKHIFVGKTLGSNSRAVAEHVISLLFADAKNTWQTISEVKAHEWNKPTGLEIYGKTLGIVGFGAIGKYLAQYARGLGMHVQAYDTFEISADVAAEYGVSVVTLDEILSTSDYVSLHVPLLDSTRHMISTAQLKQMKDSACLINTARGGIVDEEALYTALLDQQIRSACFDVFSVEPPLPTEKLLGLDNFLLTPHVASRTVESEQRTCQISTAVVVEQLLGIHYEG